MPGTFRQEILHNFSTSDKWVILKNGLDDSRK